MYRSLQLLGLGLLITFLNSSCVKDDNPAISYSSVINVNGKSHTLDKAYLLSYGPGINQNEYSGYTMELFLFSSGIDVTLNEYQYPDFEGDGCLLYFLLYSDSELALTKGVYTYERAGRMPYTFKMLIAEPLGSEKTTAEAISCQQGNLVVNNVSGSSQLLGTFKGHTTDSNTDASFSFDYNGQILIVKP